MDTKITWEEKDGKKYNFQRTLIAGVVEKWEWDLGDGGSGSGETTSHTYAQSGEYTVTLSITADHNETASTTVGVLVGPVVTHVEAVDNNDNTRRSQTELQMVSNKVFQTRSATVTAYKAADDWLPGEPVWSGIASGSGVDSVNVSTRSGGSETAEAGKVSKTVEIEIINGIEHTVTISTKDFQALKDILTVISDALGGGKLSGEVGGSVKWYYVDQTSSPLAQKSVELSAGGKFELSQKIYIPSLSFNFKYVSGGAFVEPAITLTVNAVNIKRDGRPNPVEWTGSGGAGLDGSISGGANLKILNNSEVLSAIAEAKGTAAAGGEFTVYVVPDQKLSGTYYVGKITVSGKVEIIYRGRRIVRKEFSKIVWEGITDTATVDLSSHFN